MKHTDATLERPDTPVADHGERGALRERVLAALRAELWPLPPGRLALLQQRFGLSELEADALALLWVCAFDAELRAQVLAREPYSGQLTLRLVARLFGHAPQLRPGSESPLLAWRMVVEHPLIDGNAALAPDSAVLAWLEGQTELDPVLTGRVSLQPPGLELPAWPLEGLAARLNEGLQLGQRWRLVLRGADTALARWFAAALCQRLGLPLLRVHAGAFAGEGLELAAVHLHRQAFLDACVPCFCAADAALALPHAVLPYPLQIVIGAAEALPPGEAFTDLDLALPEPGAAERERIWRHALPSVAAWPANTLADLALCQDASASEILAAAQSEPADAAAATLALRGQRRGDLAPLARRVDASFTWDDLVLAPDVLQRLRAIAFEARERCRVWEMPEAARLFPYGRGLVALFAGPPGTGKTMAAQVIAADLGLDLLSVDISAVVSKWVGETAQHLQQLLASPVARRSVLFFDEADALYGKRVDEVRDAQDRFANIDTSHLMSALEAYPGIVLMASNLKANIDAAFLRRIRHVLDFGKPDAAARAALWQRCLVALFPKPQLKKLLPQLPRLAAIEATGAVIKNASLSALFAARQAGSAPDLRLLGEMLARELAKEGAGLSVRELDDWLEAPV